jgi:hypothetical protein
VVSFTCDNGGRLTEKAFPNGASTRYVWNADNTLAQVMNRDNASTIVSQYDYAYDPLGNRLTHQELVNGVTTPYKYVYDALNRLTVRNNTTNAVIETSAYDALNNQTSKMNAAGNVTAYVYGEGKPAHGGAPDLERGHAAGRARLRREAGG